jgi:hypothetical protein
VQCDLTLLDQLRPGDLVFWPRRPADSAIDAEPTPRTWGGGVISLPDSVLDEVVGLLVDRLAGATGDAREPGNTGLRSLHSLAR